LYGTRIFENLPFPEDEKMTTGDGGNSRFAIAPNRGVWKIGEAQLAQFTVMFVGTAPFAGWIDTNVSGVPPSLPPPPPHPARRLVDAVPIAQSRGQRRPTAVVTSPPSSAGTAIPLRQAD